MKRVYIFAVVSLMLLLIVVLPSWASSNLNSSRSNVYRMVYPKDLVSQAQATAILAELDKLGPADETKLKTWFANNFRRFGIDESRVKKISISLELQIMCSASVETCKGKWVGPSLNARKSANAVCFCYGPITTPTQVRQVDKASPILILLLSDPNQEADAFAVNLNSSKSN
jgi:hypothetical protein